jgi:phage terminase large subunit
MEITVSSSFEPLLEDRHRYLVMCGGRGSGKSEFAGRKIFYRCMVEGRHRFLIMRKIRKTLEESVIFLMRRILAENDIAHEYNKSDRTIAFAGPHGTSELVFEGLDDPEKIKSIAGITSMWIEEATEFSRDDFLMVDLCLREPGPGYKQIILSFNPIESRARWLKEAFFGAVPHADATAHNSTVDDNPLKRLDPATWAAYTGTLDALRDQDEALWKISRLGLWASRTGRIFNWDVRPLPDLSFDDVWCGGDFGYSVNEAGVVKIYRKADEFWLEELVYRRGLTNPMLASEMRAGGVNGEMAYFDAAEPKSIEELQLAGINAHPCDKGPDSVRAGIDFLKSRKIHIVEGSCNLFNEASEYCWRKDGSGRELPEPVKDRDHLMDAARYGIFTHMKQGEGYLGVVGHDVRPD